MQGAPKALGVHDGQAQALRHDAARAVRRQQQHVEERVAGSGLGLGKP